MLRIYLISAVVMLILDAVQILVNRQFHAKLFKNVQKSPMKVRIVPAILVYILMPFAVTYFAILQSKSIKEAGLKGGLLGLTIFGVYDLTNLATLDGWTVEMAIMDISWGTVMFSITSAVGYYFITK
jgi:uncharacterized membrane protein